MHSLPQSVSRNGSQSPTPKILLLGSVKENVVEENALYNTSGYKPTDKKQLSN